MAQPLAQPNFQAVGGAFTTLAQELPLVQNMPVVNQAQQFQQLQDQIAQLQVLTLNRLQQIQDDQQQIRDNIQQIRDDVQQIRDDQQQVQLYADHKSIVRIFNSNVLTNDGALLQMHLPNQGVAHALFPNTRTGIAHLRANDLATLSASYGYPVGQGLNIKERRNIFAQFIGTPPLP